MIRHGFERGYREVEAEYAGIKGRLLAGPTLRRNLPSQGRTVCAFDEIEHDTSANRLIKAVLWGLLKCDGLDSSLRGTLLACLRYFRDVRLVRITARDLARITIHRNNRHYAFVLQLCAFVLSAMLPDESGRDRTFRDFTRDDQEMGKLFEAFVRNFYTHHGRECGVDRVSRPMVVWMGSPVDSASEIVWPTMQTDLCLESPGRILVIDCKFHRDAFQHWWGSESLKSHNLYQLFTYVQNLAVRSPGLKVEGMLLYPQVTQSLDFGHSACGSLLRVASLNLAADWGEIHQRLVNLASLRNHTAMATSHSRLEPESVPSS